jgi:hypothetical protein
VKKTVIKVSPLVAASGIVVFNLGVESPYALLTKIVVSTLNTAVLKFDCRILKDYNDNASSVHTFSGTLATETSTIAYSNNVPYKLYENLYIQPLIAIYLKNTTALNNGQWSVSLDYEPLFADPHTAVFTASSKVINQWTDE